MCVCERTAERKGVTFLLLVVIVLQKRCMEITAPYTPTPPSHQLNLLLYTTLFNSSDITDRRYMCY